MISDLLWGYRSHWARLRAETDRGGAEVERWSYDALDRAADAPGIKPSDRFFKRRDGSVYH